MIVFDLRCSRAHRFEAWFRDAAACEEQLSEGIVACPVCGDRGVARLPAAPRIGKAVETPPPAGRTGVEAAVAGEVMAWLRRRVRESCDYVGPDFAEEARRIHYGETARRDIYGEATDEEAAALTDEGIEICRLPWPRRNDDE